MAQSLFAGSNIGPKAHADAACVGQCGTSGRPRGSRKRHRRAAASRGYRLLPAANGKRDTSNGSRGEQGLVASFVLPQGALGFSDLLRP